MDSSDWFNIDRTKSHDILAQKSKMFRHIKALYLSSILLYLGTKSHDILAQKAKIFQHKKPRYFSTKSQNIEAQKPLDFHDISPLKPLWHGARFTYWMNSRDERCGCYRYHTLNEDGIAFIHMSTIFSIFQIFITLIFITFTTSFRLIWVRIFLFC